MPDAIIGQLENISGLITGLADGDKTPLTAELGVELGTVYAFSKSVATTVIMPVAYTVLALFFVLELYKMSMRVESAGGGTQLGVELVFRAMVKMIVCKTIVDSTPLLMEAIYNGITGLITGVSALVSAGALTPPAGAPPGGTTSPGGLNISDIEDTIRGLGFWESIPVLMLCFIIMLVAFLAVGLANVVILARFIEVFVYVCVAPLPLATLTHDEMSQIGKGFLKSFAAVGIQGLLIFVVLSFFPYLLQDAFLNRTSSGDIYLALLGVLGYSIVLILALFTTGKWAKSICQAT